jgi:hypothetical protein
MTINAHIEEFAGLSVSNFDPEGGIRTGHAQRLALDWSAFDNGEKFDDRLAAFIADDACPQTEALVIGDWGGAGQGENPDAMLEALVSARGRLPKLRALFLGEIICEESEISWITQTDVSPVFEAFPNLQELWIRGGNGLSLGRPSHAKLRKLVIETGGLSGQVVREVAAADLPQLAHLELWLGDPGYGNDVSRDDLEVLLAAPVCQNLTYLGFRDDANADGTARLLAERGIPPKVKVLDLSLGTIGDEGARAIAASSWASSLTRLDISHHYCSPAVTKQVMNVIANVDARDPQEPDTWNGEEHRYVAVAE